MSEPGGGRLGDVVEQGREVESGGLSPGVRRVALALVVAVAVLLLVRSGLLSADAPDRGEESTDRAGRTAARLVARVDERLVRRGGEPAARLPAGLAPAAALVPVFTASGTGVVLGVHDGLLFRVAPRAARWQPIGRARAVVTDSAVPGRALVWRGDDVVEVEVSTGRVTAPAPYPGFDAAQGWAPVAVVSVAATRALLMGRAQAGALEQELALAWPARRVEAGINPPLQVLGRYGPVLGLADDRVLTTTGSCPGVDCRVRAVTVTRDRVLTRDVQPPEGWTFVSGGDRPYRALVPVQRLDDSSERALARLVPGGDNALLVGGTRGVDLAAGLVDRLDGAVFLVTSARGTERVRIWRPERPGAAGLVGGGARLPASARLVCVCR